jgi:Rrf2 family protein
MSITKKTEYALRALYEIAVSGEAKPVSRKLISQKQDISEHFLEQIFIPLQKIGIIKSIRGPGGGFILGKSENDITVWDIYTALENTRHFYEKCPEISNKECERYKNCKIKYIWPKINRALKKSMTEISLKDISGEQFKEQKWKS